jgi:hypothetical protein
MLLRDTKFGIELLLVHSQRRSKNAIKVLEITQKFNSKIEVLNDGTLIIKMS